MEEKKWHACYYDTVEDRHYFWHSENPRDLPWASERLKYLGLVKLGKHDFPVKYPVFTIHNERIDRITKEKPTFSKKFISNKKVLEYNKSYIEPIPESEWSKALKREKKATVDRKERMKENYDKNRPTSNESSRLKRIRQFVLDRDGNKCLRCGTEDYLTMDHIYPKVRGGKFTIDNLQTLCLFCNEEKGSLYIDYRIETEVPKE